MRLPVLFYIYLYSSTIPILVGIAKMRWMKKHSMILFLLLVLGLLGTVGQMLLARQNLNNLWIMHVYSLILQIAISSIFFLWTTDGKFRAVLRWSTVLFGMYWVIGKFTVEPFSAWPVITSTVLNLLILALSVYALTFSIWEPTAEAGRSYYLGVVTALLLNSVGDLFLFAFGDQLMKMAKWDAAALYSIHWGVASVVSFVFAVALSTLQPPSVKDLSAAEIRA